MALLKTGDVEVRDYQKNIAKAASERSTLVVLPTGMGKTLISVLVAVERLEKFPGTKVLITAPTRPLNAQHKKSFESLTSIPKGKIVLVTGKTPPHERAEMYDGATVVIATPQTIENDLREGRLNMRDFSFVTFDESHRGVKDYAYSDIARKFMLQSRQPLVLALTASPGWTESKIKEVCKNLFIKAVEIRSESDGDVEEYVKPVDRDYVYVDFPEDFKRIRGLLQDVLKEDMEWLKSHHYVPTTIPSRTMLLGLQNRTAARYSATKNYMLIWPLIRSAEAIKLSHAIELIETQGIPFLHEYFEKMKGSKKRTDQRLLKHGKIIDAIGLIEGLNDRDIDHPKTDKIREMVRDFVDKDPETKIIIFANFRSTVDKIKKFLEKDGIPTETLVGQSMKNGSGMSQDEQIDVLKRFRDGKFNVLCGTSVSEEGIDVPSVDYAIFHEAVPSEIRAIQRRGRIGRHSAGKAIFLITRGTRDEAYFFSSMNKERKMKKVLRDMKETGIVNKKRNLMDWASD
ncbi:MAG: DEAD/DEAH box helicase [Candidatus Aenigmarchaeota archaeon]|nr:DEAD/DEAH box helicase [Candidatus Aenigmarchaeota archaeon]